ncbi:MULTISPECIES: glycosyltransferase family 2 protein [unclassified Sphingopyxis]|uniref:glycosyltransferase family 2 protein n=1 Tax=unclassified Sphingopyxis TaxID=2614943 RepID=UPI000730BAA2|nr:MULTISPECIES: glycosyltransferase family 2 protein [unclassified Sphingopyxis]KTE25961.1 glycosyl transferase family 2 [Sphingopyxis sp. H057]KTE48909.1 glycosyl transferase family 2 [Sphingopyxis sp. H071]KTE51025.1 glycosyl transferase family 2 [Sphingopyxis sp. H107]KTE51641.1 glycosyl transferase family 2 [Sphingopyxis sp. H073]KTE58773.1 glycosyl transferase family 2 [Sphingopyxis sp. H100]
MQTPIRLPGRVRLEQTLAVVIPSYRVKAHILDVIARIGPEVAMIFVVDDACPDGSGAFVGEQCRDPRVRVLRHEVNRGVGGAMMTGYRAALGAGADIIVKVDGDGQMDPALIPHIARPVLARQADYAKGNRFHSLWNVRRMPRVRLYGNAALSFMTKLSSGYWGIFDPTNGYTAIHAAALERIEFANVSERYFFETDMLINLGNARAVVADVPMEAVYADEVSNLRIRNELWPFLRTHLREVVKRIFYTYFLRDFSPATLQLLIGAIFLLFGTIYGAAEWYRSVSTGEIASTGTVMIAVLPIILGVQLLLNFLAFDMANEPKVPIQPTLTLADLFADDPAADDR